MIPIRDLIAFSTESSDDANLLMNQLREVMGKKANVICLENQSADKENIRLRYTSQQFPKDADFKVIKIISKSSSRNYTHVLYSTVCTLSLYKLNLL